MAHVLGIDLGGTKILAGIVDIESGEVVASAKKRTRAEHQASDVLQRLLAAADEALEESGLKRSDLVAAGIGAAGQVDPETGTIIRAPNLPDDLQGAPLAQQVQSHVGCPVTLGNDVASAAAGEAGFGAARGHKDFVCIFVGTGIGGGIYQNGVPYQGSTHTAGELGHMVIDHGGRICGCGGLGHLEAYASRTAVVRTILAAMHQGRDSSLRSLEPNPDPNLVTRSAIRSKALAHAVQAADPLTLEMVESAARYMASGLVSIINFYNPPRIVLGGGLVQEVDLYFQIAAGQARQQSLSVPGASVEIVKAGLGDFSVVVGAALVAATRAQSPTATTA